MTVAIDRKRHLLREARTHRSYLLSWILRLEALLRKQHRFPQPPQPEIARRIDRPKERSSILNAVGTGSSGVFG